MIKILLMLIVLPYSCIFKSAYATPNNTQAQSMQQEILYYINQYRTQHRLSPLVANSAISRAATQHSLDMAQHRTPFGHEKFDQRIHKLFKKIPNSNGGAENVAYAYKDAQTVVSNWLKSSGHRQNIRGNYNLTGIGIARDAQGKLYFTQMFVHTQKRTATS